MNELQGAAAVGRSPGLSREFSFQVELVSPLRTGPLREAMSSDWAEGQPVLQATAIRGAVRDTYGRWKRDILLTSGSEVEEVGLGPSVPPQCFDEELLFGGISRRAQIVFSDLHVANPNSDSMWRTSWTVRLDPCTGKPLDSIRHSELEAGTILRGSIVVPSSIPGVVRNVLLTSLLDVQRTGLGGQRVRGFGRTEFRLLGAPPSEVFISYAWLQPTHMARASEIANALAEYSIVHFDQLESDLLSTASRAPNTATPAFGG